MNLYVIITTNSIFVKPRIPGFTWSQGFPEVEDSTAEIVESAEFHWFFLSFSAFGGLPVKCC